MIWLLLALLRRCYADMIDLWPLMLLALQMRCIIIPYLCDSTRYACDLCTPVLEQSMARESTERDSGSDESEPSLGG